MGGIDWDLDVTGASPASGEAGPGTSAVEVDWDIDLSALQVEVGAQEAEAGTGAGVGVDIDWDVAVDVAASGEAGTAPALDIDWDISGFEAGEAGEGAATTAGTSGAGAEAERQAGSQDGRAAAQLRLEEDVDYRSRLLDDLQVRPWPLQICVLRATDSLGVHTMCFPAPLHLCLLVLVRSCSSYHEANMQSSRFLLPCACHAFLL